MLVDWFIVLAQIINFLILVALLRWFLYRPVLSVMGKRREGIQRDWDEARQLQDQARAELAEHRRLRERLEAEKQTWLERARGEVEQERQRSLELMRQEVSERRLHWQQNLEREQAASLDRLRVRLLDEVQSVARRALADLASVGLEEQIIDRFLERLQQLEPQRRQELLRELERQDGGVSLSTGFSLPAERREELRRRLVGCLPPLERAGLTFRRQPDLLCGIELRTPGQVVGWNLDQYLASLEGSLSEALGREPSHALVQPGG